MCTHRSTAGDPERQTWKGSAPACVWTVQEPSLRKLAAVAEVSWNGGMAWTTVLVPELGDREGAAQPTDAAPPEAALGEAIV